MTTNAVAALAAPDHDRLEDIGAFALAAFVGALQFSIAVAQILLISRWFRARPDEFANTLAPFERERESSRIADRE